MLSIDTNILLYAQNRDCAEHTVWTFAGRRGVARRRLFDARLGFTLLHHGVRELATRNLKDFDGLGFERVWDPIAKDTD